jgi:hypothetical protein
MNLDQSPVLADEDVSLQAGQRLEVQSLVTIVVALAAGRQDLEDDDRVDGRLLVVRRVIRLATDDRSVGVPAARVCRDPEPLVGRIVAAGFPQPDSEQHRELARDGVVFVRSSRHGHDDTVDELVTVLAVLLHREVFGVGCHHALS